VFTKYGPQGLAPRRFLLIPRVRRL
jgi:hypothetical protein